MKCHVLSLIWWHNVIFNNAAHLFGILITCGQHKNDLNHFTKRGDLAPLNKFNLVLLKGPARSLQGKLKTKYICVSVSISTLCLRFSHFRQCRCSFFVFMFVLFVCSQYFFRFNRTPLVPGSCLLSYWHFDSGAYWLWIYSMKTFIRFAISFLY